MTTTGPGYLGCPCGEKGCQGHTPPPPAPTPQRHEGGDYHHTRCHGLNCPCFADGFNAGTAERNDTPDGGHQPTSPQFDR